MLCSPRLPLEASPKDRRGDLVATLATSCSTSRSPLTSRPAPDGPHFTTPANDNQVHPQVEPTPSSKGQAILLILMVEIHAVPIHQKARPGRLPSAPDGLSDWWPHRAHNKRLDLTDANRYGAGPGASAIERVRSSVAGVVQPTPGRTEAPGLPHPSGLSALSKSTSPHHRLARGPLSDSLTSRRSPTRRSPSGRAPHHRSLAVSTL